MVIIMNMDEHSNLTQITRDTALGYFNEIIHRGLHIVVL